MTSTTTLQIGIVGGGAVATAFALELGREAAYCDVVVWARHADEIRSVLHAASSPARVTEDLAEVAGRATVIIAVTDGAIGAVAERLRDLLPQGSDPASDPAGEPTVVLHTSGAATGASALPALAATGAALGSLHPLVAVGRATSATGRFEGLPFAVEGCRAGCGVGDSARALERATAIVWRLGGHVITLPLAGDADAQARTKALYHALATMVATGVVTAVDRAARELGDSEEQRAEFRSAFARLAASAAANVLAGDGADVLTGPIARGDAATLALHADVLAGTDSEALYHAVRRAAEDMLKGDRA